MGSFEASPYTVYIGQRVERDSECVVVQRLFGYRAIKQLSVIHIGLKAIPTLNQYIKFIICFCCILDCGWLAIATGGCGKL